MFDPRYAPLVNWTLVCMAVALGGTLWLVCFSPPVRQRFALLAALEKERWEVRLVDGFITISLENTFANRPLDKRRWRVVVDRLADKVSLRLIEICNGSEREFDNFSWFRVPTQQPLWSTMSIHARILKRVDALLAEAIG